jgi:Zn-dependent protease with chaperone function
VTEDHLDPRLEFSEWLHRRLVAEFAKETEAWARERVERVTGRLNRERLRRPALNVEILWIAPCSAFTLTGRHIYLSRRLLERLPTDDATAFVIAHEMAHHDCGHFALFAGWADRLPRNRATGYLASALRVAEHQVQSPERENEADLHALQLCMKAGYDGELALQALAILENAVLDAGDYDGVFGPENLLDPTDPDAGTVSSRLQRWIWQRSRGYVPLRERRERLHAWLKASGARHAR